MDPLEIEVKFLISDIESLRQKISKIGAIPHGRVFEQNIRYENSDCTLGKNRSLLRLRQDSKATLTVKTEPPEPDDQFKIHREWEVEISDFEQMAAILDFLKFHPEQTYEKWRETYRTEGACLCLDTLPFGTFLEIEGGKNDILSVAKSLALKWEDRILLNYLALFQKLKDRYKLDFRDVTFDNFKSIQTDFRPCIRQLTCGHSDSFG